MDINKLIELIEEEMVCANACPEHNKHYRPSTTWSYEIKKCNCYKKAVIQQIREMHESLMYCETLVKLSAHYASLLNMHDGGERMEFTSVGQWCERQKQFKQTYDHE